MGANAGRVDNEQDRHDQDLPTTQEWQEAMAEAIAEAKAKANMHEMEGDVMIDEHEVRTPRMDGLQRSPYRSGGRLSTTAEGTGARPTRAEEVRRGKQPMTPSQ
jgi:hypothetical protein